MSKSKPRVGDIALPEDSKSLAEFEALLAYLKQSRGFDFTAYKRSSLMRRVLVRMQTMGVKGFATYLDFLQVDPEEFTRLFNTILINVTSFFRDPANWDVLREAVIPRLVGSPDSAEAIRVWSAGCASGEEAYSIAILLAEAIGPDAFRDRVKIYATDVDEEALNQARHAVYGPRTSEDVPAPLLEKYFDRQDDRYMFNKELRRSVIFGRHDLIQDAPISRVDLLICRNCLMYFNTEAQARILARFHFALVPSGVLFLGKAETLLAQSATFEPVDIKRRLFIKADRQLENRHLTFAPPNGYDRARHLREVASDTSPVAQLVVDADGLVVQMNQPLRTMFGLSPRDTGRPLQDLEISYRPFELRSCIERAYMERRPVSAVDGRWTGPGSQVTFLELSVVPLLDTSGMPLGVSVYFIDVSRQRQLQEEVHRSGQELETALEELQSTNEELETTNEELQSTVEELETTNEELQSTNEELETMNEELQSTNEELQTINEEARERGDQLGELNSFLESILTSLRSAVAVVDRDLHVRKWSRRAEDLWGLRADEVVQKNFLNLDIGLPVERLRSPIRACLAGEAEFLDLTLDATNRRGRAIHVRVTCTPLSATPTESARGVILVMEELDGRP
ncbi:MAG TPA: CheR family methyltransferase [Gemmatimonadales bacterium]|nr:CheR family methyltransferase [Gemmatimonadales bacterium]